MEKDIKTELIISLIKDINDEQDLEILLRIIERIKKSRD